MTAKTLTKRINRILAAVLTIAALAAGQTTEATTKTVTYTINDFMLEQTTNNYTIVFTRTGDIFDTSPSAPTTYMTHVPKSSFGNDNYNGNFSVELADGFYLFASWRERSNVNIIENCIYPTASGEKIKYEVSCTTNNYYVTHVTMKGTGNPWLDTSYDNQQSFKQNYESASSFGAITVTYTDTPPVMNWASIQTAINASTDADNPTVITLDCDVEAGSTDGYLEVPAGHHVIIDLNGHKIDRNMTESKQGGYVILLNGQSNNHASLVVRDSSNPSTGKITGGFDGTDGGNSAAGGINVQYGDLTLEGGSICGNKCTFSGGGGVRVAAGTFTMTGGSITGNVVNTLKNSTARAGGALYGISGDIYLRGGSITDNTTYSSSYACGGIAHDYANGAAQLHLSGTFTLSGNQKLSYDTSTQGWTTVVGSDYLHGNRELIYLEGPISPTAPIAIDLYSNYNARLTTNWSTHMSTADPDDCFTLVANSENSGKGFYPLGNELHIGIPESLYWGADANHDGSWNKPFIITTTDGLDYLAIYVNGGNDTYDKYFQLGKDITYTHKAANEAGADTENNYTAIGTESNWFNGTFDGNNKTISGIRIYKPNDHDQGLFGYNYGTVKNVTVTDAIINGFSSVGGIAGACGYGSIQDCFVIDTNVSGNWAGAIVGYYDNSDVRIGNNHYRNCTRYDDTYTATTNIGTYQGDGDGARIVFTITTDPSISISDNVAVTYQNVNYYVSEMSFFLYYSGGSEYLDMPAMDVIPLLNGFDNTDFIAANNGSGKNVILTDRTLYQDGAWNTLCLPFDFTAEQIAASRLANATLMELDTEGTYDGHKTGFDASTGTLNLYFKDASSIVAGKPYIIKWNINGISSIQYPTFSGITIDNSAEAIARKTVTSADGKVSFKGTYGPVPFTANDKNILFLGAENKLYWPSADMNFGALRAYFKLNDPTATVKEFRLSFGEEDEVNGVSEVNASLEVLPSGQAQAENDNSWYSLDGRKLSGKPTRRGIFINGGRKVIIQ